QLMWRAAGVVVYFLLFPLAVMDLLPSAAYVLDGTVFVVTLVVPIVRYRLWEIDAVIRRVRAGDGRPGGGLPGRGGDRCRDRLATSRHCGGRIRRGRGVRSGPS